MTDHMPLDIPTPTPPGGLPVQLIRPFGLVLRRPHSAHPVIKLLGVLRGRGALLAPTGEIPVDYEIDAFSAGSVRTATGGLTGAFDTWPDLAGVTETTGLAAQLRLAGGGLLAVTIVGGDSGLLEIDLPCNALLMKRMNPRRAD
jgi:hypothetical protein